MLALALLQTVALVHPTTTSSADEHLRFSVDPSERQGRGAARCRLERDGRVVWEQELASTPRDAFVDDSGVVACWSPTGVAILAPDGASRFEQRLELQPVQGFGNPFTREYVVRGEEWWSFALAADRPPRKLAFVGCAPDFEAPIAACAVPGTAFTLVLERASWWQARFRVLDPELKELWRAPDEDPRQRPNDWRIARWVASGAALVPGPAARSFTTVRANEGEARRYELVPPAAEGAPWTVEERARQPFATPLEPPVPRCAPIELEVLGESWLGSHADASGLHGCVALAYGKELLEGVRRTAGRFERFTCNARGELVGRQVLAWEPPANALVLWARLAPGSWVAAAADRRARRAELVAFEGPEGAARTLRRWKDVDLVALDARADAGIALLFDSPSRASVWALDAAGKDRWRLPREQDIGQARDLVWAAADTLAILDAGAGGLDLFDLAKGTRTRLPIADELGARPFAPEELLRTPAGGFSVRDWDDDHDPVFWYSDDGRTWERCSSALRRRTAWEESSAISTLLLPDGSAWIADGHLVTRSARDGTPIEVLGELRARDRAAPVVATAVDDASRILIRTDAQGEVEAWSADGQRLERGAQAAREPVWRVSQDATELEPVAGGRALQRRPDAHWFRTLRALAPARDASLAVTDDAGDASDLESAALSWYGPGAEPRSVEHAPWIAGARLARNARWIACWHEDGKLYLFDTQAQRWAAVELERETGRGTIWDLHFPPDEGELWAVSRETRRLVRYALPRDG